MVAAVGRLALISVAALCMTFLVLYFVRWAGGQQTFAPPPHPWFTAAKWEVVEPPTQELCPPKAKGSWFHKTEPGTFWWVRIHFGKQGWSAPCEPEAPLAEVLKNSFHANWLFFVDARASSHLEEITRELTAYDKSKNFGIYSPSQAIARDLRKRAPQWVYGADTATLLRLHLSAGFWLETAFDFWPDFVVQIPTDPNTHLSQRELNELQRRKKRIIQMR